MSYSKNRPACPPAHEGGLLKQLYRGALRPLLPLAASKAVSSAGGFVMSSPLSRPFIKGFVRRNAIDMNQYIPTRYPSFNDFFTRSIRPGARPIPKDGGLLISPCDSRLTAYDISDDLTFEIKGGRYSVASLLKNPPLAQGFAGGLCLVFRLSVDDYHRYCYFDDGKKGENIVLPGRYYTVQPIALERADFYKENSRQYTVMDTGHFGRAVQVEIGATFVGRISNFHGRHTFCRGEEKGMFEFGGSTVVLLLQKGAAALDGDIAGNSSLGFETRVLMGEVIGRSLLTGTIEPM